MTLRTMSETIGLVRHVAERCWLLGGNPVDVKVYDNGNLSKEEATFKWPDEISVQMRFETERDGSHGMMIVFCLHELMRVNNVRGWIESVFRDEFTKYEAAVKTRRCNFAGAAC